MMPRTGSKARGPRGAQLSRRQVLDLIRRLGPTSRGEIAYHADLTTQSISNIVNAAIDEGLVVTVGQDRSEGGKPRSLVDLEPSAVQAAGVLLGPDAVECCVSDLRGAVLARAQFDAPLSESSHYDLEQVAAMVARFLQDPVVERERLLGVGVAAPGTVDVARGLIESNPGQPDSPFLAAREVFERSLGVPVIVDNDGSASALGELWQRRGEASANFLFVHLGYLVGSGIVLAGRPVSSTLGNPGSFGRITVLRHGADMECAGHGLLQDFCSREAVIAEASRRIRAGTPSVLHLGGTPDTVAADMAAVLEAATQGDPVARAAVVVSARALGEAVVNLLNVIEVEQVVIGGRALGKATDLYCEEVRGAIRTQSMASRLHPCEVEPALGLDDSAVIGAATLVLASEFAPWAID